MNRLYEFYFNDNGIFTCIKTTKDNQIIYYGEKAITMLRNKDKINFNKAKVSEEKIILSNGDTSLVIRDLEEFYENDLCSCISHSLPKIKKAIIKYQKKENSSFKKGNGKKVLVAGIIVTLLLFASSKLQKDYDGPVIDIDSIEEDYDSIINLNSQVVVENDTTKAIVDIEDEYVNTNDLLEELDKENDQIFKDSITSTYLRYDTVIDEVKADYAYDNYYDIVETYSTKWGISPNLAIGMLTQESGGYNINLMQIQFDSWIDMPLTSYDFIDDEYETIVLTDNPENYKGRGFTCISREELNNPKTNISVGCLILKKSCEMMNYHIGAGIQCYNFGNGNMNKVLNTTATANGVTVSEILDDQRNLSFMEFTDIISVGDPNYLQNVLRYVDAPEEGVSIKYIDETGCIQEECIAILPDEKTL